MTDGFMLVVLWIAIAGFVAFVVAVIWTFSQTFLKRVWARLDCLPCWPFGGHVLLGGQAYRLSRGLVYVDGINGRFSVELGIAKDCVASGSRLEDFVSFPGVRMFSKFTHGLDETDRLLTEIQHTLDAETGIPRRLALPVREMTERQLMVASVRAEDYAPVAYAVARGNSAAERAAHDRAERERWQALWQADQGHAPVEPEGNRKEPEKVELAVEPVHPLDRGICEHERASGVELEAVLAADDDSF